MTNQPEVEKLLENLRAENEPVAVHIVLELEGGAGSVDGVHLDEETARKRCEELNFREDDPNFACVVTKLVSTRTGHLTIGNLR